MPIGYVRAAVESRYCAAGKHGVTYYGMTVTMWIATRNVALAVAVTGLLWGCGSHDGTPGQKVTRANAARKAAKVNDGSQMLVSAVAATKPGTMPLQVKFALKGRPDVGQPLDVDLVIVPLSASVDRVVGKIEAGDGLDVQDGAQIAAIDRPVEGTAIHHAVRVLPKRDGIFTFNAILTVDSGGQSTSETYSMPLIAGAGVPELPAAPTASATTATPTAPATAAAR